ncbi:MAG TPA: hypothetical protein VGM06_09670 [Polyangiaceae bacterium]|jgi:hypothetical protein
MRLVLLLAWSAGVPWIACGGTTGREGLPQQTAPTSDASDSTFENDGSLDAGSDATLGMNDTADAAIDVAAIIMYADAARLPKVPDASVLVDAGAVVEPWSVWPTCAPDSPIFDPTNPLQVLGESADDGGACTGFNWLAVGDAGVVGDAGKACGDCLRENVCGVPVVGGVFPPCSDLREAGTAAEGTGAGQPLFDLCASLFDCVAQTSCVGTSSEDPNAMTFNCYCGTAAGGACLVPGAANGPCKTQIEAAFQVAQPVTAAGLSDLVSNLTNVTSSTKRAGGEVLALFGCGIVATCDTCFFDGGSRVQ